MLTCDDCYYIKSFTCLRYPEEITRRENAAYYSRCGEFIPAAPIKCTDCHYEKELDCYRYPTPPAGDKNCPSMELHNCGEFKPKL